jgi:hypothetical protein
VTTRWVLVAVALLTFVIQLVSASTGPDKTYSSLNAAQEIAGNLAWKGRYEGGNWVRLKGVVRPQDPPLRAFNLPGYVWYAAAMWRAFPWAHRYIQIPVVVTLTVAVAATAALLGGPTLGLLSGLIAALDPFIVVHGPVWDDAVFGTALLWVIFAIAIHRWRRDRDTDNTDVWAQDILVGVLAGLAALTRTEAQAIVLALAVLVWILPALRPLRRTSLLATAGVVIALTAWGIRNEGAIGAFHTGSTHDGVTLWESNNAFSRRALAQGQVDHLWLDSSLMLPYWSQTAAMTEAGADAYFRHAAAGYIASHPGDIALTSLDKLAVSLSGVRPEQPLRDSRNVVSVAYDAVLILLTAIAVAQLARAPRLPTRMTLLQVLAIVTIVVIGLLLIGPAGIRYWLTLRAAMWTLTAVTLLQPRGDAIIRARSDLQR